MLQEAICCRVSCRKDSDPRKRLPRQAFAPRMKAKRSRTRVCRTRQAMKANSFRTWWNQISSNLLQRPKVSSRPKRRQPPRSKA